MRLEELTLVEEQAELSQAELSRASSTKSKLESLFRQLQQQTATLTEERRQLTEAERQRRQVGAVGSASNGCADGISSSQDLADEFQLTIADVKKKMDQQVQRGAVLEVFGPEASERSRLALENEVLRSRFKEFFEKYDTWLGLFLNHLWL